MVEVNCNRFKEFMSTLDPAGHEFIFDFLNADVGVKAINSSNDLILYCSMDLVTNFNGTIGWDIDLVRKLIPKGYDTVDMIVGKDKTSVNAAGYKATINSINQVSCQRLPKKDANPGEDTYQVNPQEMYEKLLSLKSAFDGSGFIMVIDPMNQLEISLSESDSSIGSMETGVETISGFNKKIRVMLPYDNVLLPLKAVRLICDRVDLRFMPLPSNDSASALVIEGVSEKENLPTIEFRYVVAPRIET